MPAMTPFFVYGTLRPGGGRDGAFPAGSTFTEATLTGYEMWEFRRGAYPYLAPGDGIITGNLVVVPPGAHESVVRILDRIEGYGGADDPRNLYNRVKVNVDVDGAPREAYAYVTNSRLFAREQEKGGLVLVQSGDWFKRDRSA